MTSGIRPPTAPCSANFRQTGLDVTAPGVQERGMAGMTFQERMQQAWAAHGSMVCVGLDPDLARMPEGLGTDHEELWVFLREIIDATAPAAAAFKPQIAYFAALGAEAVLERVMAYLQERHPRQLRILDSKRGDIGSTAQQYAVEAFVRYRADAVTVNPYLGGDAVAPFLARPECGAFLLCRTSNPGARDLQDLAVGNGRVLYEEVARLATGPWSPMGNAGLVVGATYPAEMARLRAQAPAAPFLVPGVGAQGGDVQAVVHRGRTAAGTGLFINSSRAILYASSGRDFAAAAGRAAAELDAAIRNAG